MSRLIKKTFGLSLVALVALGGCDRKNNPLLSSPAGGVSSATLFIPQIDTNGTTENRIFVSVVDQTGAPISGFQIGNFSILEGGIPGVPFEVGVVQEPLYLALAIDRSGSMAGSRETAANNAATALINALGASDYAALIEFESDVRTTVGFTNNKTTLTSAIAAGTSSGSTAVYDAIVAAADLLQHQPGRRLLLVLTDGEDNSSTNTVGTAIDAVNKKGLSAYPVGIGSDFGATVLQHIATATGGSFYSSATGSDLDSIFIGVLDRFNKLTYIKYRRRAKGEITAYLNYGSLTATSKKSLD